MATVKTVNMLTNLINSIDTALNTVLCDEHSATQLFQAIIENIEPLTKTSRRMSEAFTQDLDSLIDLLQRDSIKIKLMFIYFTSDQRSEMTDRLRGLHDNFGVVKELLQRYLDSKPVSFELEG